jgi:hypothetical protein
MPAFLSTGEDRQPFHVIGRRPASTAPETRWGRCPVVGVSLRNANSPLAHSLPTYDRTKSLLLVRRQPNETELASRGRKEFWPIVVL